MKINKYNKNIVMFTLKEIKEELDFIVDSELYILCSDIVSQVETEIKRIIRNETSINSNTYLIKAINDGMIIDNNTFDYVKNYLLFSIYIEEENDTLKLLKDSLYQNDILRFNIISKNIGVEEIKEALLHSIIVKDLKEENMLKELLNDLYKSKINSKEEICFRDILTYGSELCSYISYFGVTRFKNRIFENNLVQTEEEILIYENGNFIKRKVEYYKALELKMKT